MPTKPAVQGLLKHQLMFSQGQLESSVTTIWTYKNQFPIPQTRVDAEQQEIEGWVIGFWRTAVGNGVSADRIKTWDFGVTPPGKFEDELIFPRIFGSGGATMFYACSAVVALRSQAVGSEVRNRLNGRIYHPVGQTSVDASAATVNGAGQAAIIAIYHELRNRLDPATHPNCGDWVIPSWEVGSAPRAVPLLVGVDHVLVRQQIGLQRRRMLKATAYARGA